MAGIFAHGAQLRFRSTPGIGAFDVVVAHYKTTSGPTMRVEIIDTTTHQSTGGFREKTAGLIDAGDLSFGINWEPSDASHDATSGLLAMFRNKTETEYQLEFPELGVAGTAGNPFWEFGAIVTQFEVSTPIDNVLEATVALTILSEPDFTQTV